MIHDLDLIDQIQSLQTISFDNTVFRVTGMNADPTAFSANGGRWAVPEIEDGGFSVLYTSLVDKGAIAEVASYLALLTPVPQKPLKLHTLEVTADKTLKIAVTDFESLGIDSSTYGRRNYRQTQRVGAAVNFLEFDGLMAPSARWKCDNLMVFEKRSALNSKLEIAASEEIPFDDWIALADSF